VGITWSGQVTTYFWRAASRHSGTSPLVNNASIAIFSHRRVSLSAPCNNAGVFAGQSLRCPNGSIFAVLLHRIKCGLKLAFLCHGQKPMTRSASAFSVARRPSSAPRHFHCDSLPCTFNSLQEARWLLYPAYRRWEVIAVTGVVASQCVNKMVTITDSLLRLNHPPPKRPSAGSPLIAPGLCPSRPATVVLHSRMRVERCRDFSRPSAFASTTPNR
jgi:hypothetical protein